MNDYDSMTDEHVQQHLDDLRAHHPINGALQDLAPFLIHAAENKGIITPQNVMYLVEAAEQAVNVLLPECQKLAEENALLRQRNKELMFIAAGVNGIGGNA
ncbi:MAG: hypothetical protein PHN84_15370 [Desulfuromonadaceae bacterium]|nr:hypothetical protein [Desulfuromonadaceae bacterium]MDD2857022.1 hypothetical protein [Desulfuromonadaceae bacterium]